MYNMMFAYYDDQFKRMENFVNHYLDPGCFEKDQFGNHIVDLAQDMPLEDGLRMTHRVIASIISTGGIVLNVLLLYFIGYHSSNLGDMRPVLAFNVVVDLIDAICYFFLMPFVFTCYGYHITFGNGWFSFHSTIGNALLTGITASVLISTWGFVPIQFLYRMSLVKDGGRPQGLRLFIYIAGTAIGTIFAFITATNCYITTPEIYVNNSLKVLRHSGFIVEPDFAHGGVSTDSRIIIYHCYFMFMALVSYSIIFYAAMEIQKFLKLLAPRMSSATRRMHKEMTRVLFALAVGPLVNHFLVRMKYRLTTPIWIIIAPFDAECAAFSSMISSCFLVLTPFLNPIFTLVFIRPYRKIIVGWFYGMVGAKMQTTTSVHSANGVSVADNSKHGSNTIAMIA